MTSKLLHAAQKHSFLTADVQVVRTEPGGPADSDEMDYEDDSDKVDQFSLLKKS
jgi:hypothetical protein